MDQPIDPNIQPAQQAISQKPRKIAIIVIAVLVLAGAAYGVYYGWQKLLVKGNPSPSPQGTAIWQTYTNSQYGFELKYPDSFQYREESDNSGFFKVSFYKKNDQDGSFLVIVNGIGFSICEGPETKMITKSVGGIEAEGQDCGTVLLYFKKQENQFALVSYLGDPLTNEIVSTFKFIN